MKHFMPVLIFAGFVAMFGGGCSAPVLDMGSGMVMCGVTEIVTSPHQNLESHCIRYTVQPGFHVSHGFDEACEADLRQCVIVQPGEWVRVWADLDHSMSELKSRLDAVDCSETCPVWL